MPDLEVLEHPRPHSVSWLPDAIIDFYTSRGKRLSWQRGGEENISRVFGDGLRVVRLADLEQTEDGKPIAELLRQHRMTDDNGYIRAMDCVLMEQSEEQWRHGQRFEEYRKAQIESGASHTNKLRQSLEELVKQVGGSPRAADLVRGELPDVREVINP